MNRKILSVIGIVAALVSVVVCIAFCLLHKLSVSYKCQVDFLYEFDRPFKGMPGRGILNANESNRTARYESIIDDFRREMAFCWPSGSVGTATLVTTNYIGPMTVSFRGIAVSELPCEEEDTITGCFTNGHRRTHTFAAGAGRAHPIKDGNFWFVDAAHIAATLSDWSPGGELVWKIPVGWHRRGVSEDMFYVFQPDYEQWLKEDSRQLKILPVYSQRFRIGPDGVFKVDKFGHWTSRSRSCRVVLDGETLQWNHPQ